MTASPRNAHPVRIGLKFSPQHCSLDEQRGVWRMADEAGFDHLWNFDHFNPISGALDGVIWEGWTLLAAMAAVTGRVRIGCMVTGNTYRHPGVLAKMATTVDHLSGGRLEFGLGAAWAEAEHRMLGLDFPPVGERIGRLGEACVLIKKLWTEEKADFDGRYYRLEEAMTAPKPLQRPHPPVWIGGGGERRTLRVVAEHADVWNFAGGPVDFAVHKSQVLDRHCADAGRDPSEIRRSAQVRFDLTDPDFTFRLLDEFVEAGFTELVVIVAGADPVGQAERVAREVLPRFRG